MMRPMPGFWGGGEVHAGAAQRVSEPSIGRGCQLHRGRLLSLSNT